MAVTGTKPAPIPISTDETSTTQISASPVEESIGIIGKATATWNTSRWRLNPIRLSPNGVSVCYHTLWHVRADVKIFFGQACEILVFICYWSLLASWCFEPSQPLGNTSRLKSRFKSLSLSIVYIYIYIWWWLFPRVRGFWEKIRPFIPCLLFFFFFEMEISSRTLILLFMPGSVHNGSASWDDCGWMFHEKLHVSSFQDRFPHYAWTAA